MTPKLTFALLVAALLVPTAGCGSTSANPISSGGSGGTGGTGTTTATGAGATGGSAGNACDPACGAGAVCVDGACHTIAKLDTTGQVNNGTCSIVTDATNVYWMTGNLARVPKAGGPSSVLAGGTPSPGGLVVDDTYLYWTYTGIQRAMKDATGNNGTDVGEYIADESGATTHLVSDGTTLYWLDNSAIDQAPMDAPPAPFATPTPLTGTDALGSDAPIAVDATSVYYWAEAASVLTKADKTTLSTTTLATRDMFDGIGTVDGACSIVVDGDTVYYSTDPLPGMGGGVVARVTGPQVVTAVVDSSEGATGPFAVDAESVYFMTVSGVMKVGKTGGTPVLVSPLSLPTPYPSCIAADDTYVYWVDGVTLMQYRK
jgi:hypothetical protein